MARSVWQSKAVIKLASALVPSTVNRGLGILADDRLEAHLTDFTYDSTKSSASAQCPIQEPLQSTRKPQQASHTLPWRVAWPWKMIVGVMPSLVVPCLAVMCSPVVDWNVKLPPTPTEAYASVKVCFGLNWLPKPPLG